MSKMFFIKSAGILLMLTALAKLYTAIEGTRIINLHDPILGFRFRYEFLVVGFVELAIACLCIITPPAKLQLGLIAWLATSFAVYRLGLWSIGIDACFCLGNFPDALHLSKTAANILTVGMLTYLLAGSYCGLLRACLKNHE